MRGESPELPDFSDETLFGYLLGGLTDAEMAQVDAALESSPELRQRLDDLKVLMDPLTGSAQEYEPRSDLVQETLSLVAEQGLQPNRSGRFSDSTYFDWSETPKATRIAWMDSFVAIAAGILFLSFLLPTVWQWRETARQFACAENLRHVGYGLLSYVNFSPSRQIPPIEVQGPKAFAGMYAIHLRDQSMLDSVRWVQCPSNRSISTLSFIPTSDQFLAATPEQQNVFRYLVGGNYAYNLGVLVDGSYRTPRLDLPIRFAVLGDRWPSVNGVVEDTSRPLSLHGDRAANMLFNDGSIRLIRIPTPGDSGSRSAASIDNPFLNQELEQGVGIGIEDACLGPSYWRPSVDIDRVK